MYSPWRKTYVLGYKVGLFVFHSQIVKQVKNDTVQHFISKEMGIYITSFLQMLN